MLTVSRLGVNLNALGKSTNVIKPTDSITVGSFYTCCDTIFSGGDSLEIDEDLDYNTSAGDDIEADEKDSNTHDIFSLLYLNNLNTIKTTDILKDGLGILKDITDLSYSGNLNSSVDIPKNISDSDLVNNVVTEDFTLNLVDDILNIDNGIKIEDSNLILYTDNGISEVDIIKNIESGITQIYGGVTELNLDISTKDIDLELLHTIANDNFKAIDLLDIDYYNVAEDLDIIDLDVLTPVLDSELFLNSEDNGESLKVLTKPILLRKEQIVADMVKTVDFVAKEGVQKLKIQLSPKELGDMLVEIVKTDEKVKMTLTLSDADLYKLVEKNIKDINNQLSDMAIKVNEVSVELETDLSSAFFNSDGKNSKDKDKESHSGSKKDRLSVRGIENIIHSRSIEVIKDDKVTICVQ